MWSSGARHRDYRPTRRTLHFRTHYEHEIVSSMLLGMRSRSCESVWYPLRHALATSVGRGKSCECHFLVKLPIFFGAGGGKGWTVYPPIFDLKLTVVKARVPNQKRPREWRVGLKILGGFFSRWWTKRSDNGELALDDARSKNNEHTEQKREMISRERWNTRSLELCVPILSMIFGKINGAKANSLGCLFGRLPSLYGGVSSY